jgi:phage shock protein A
VTTLVRANLNDLIEKAEDPEKVLKQIVLDMQNQLIQVKTQVAMAVADEHLLQRRQREHQDAAAAWLRKAELALGRDREDLARAALERQQGELRLAAAFGEQVDDQREQVEQLKTALRKLERKIAEAEASAELLLARGRRARAVERAGDAQRRIGDGSSLAAFDRMKRRVLRDEAVSHAKAELAAEDGVADHLGALEREAAIERALAELKARRQSA